jgi:hypothetical protein
VKIAVMKEANQVLADCSTYHRVPLHFRVADNRDEAVPPLRQDLLEMDDLDASIHAPDMPQGPELAQPPLLTLVDLELEQIGMERDP